MNTIILYKCTSVSTNYRTALPSHLPPSGRVQRISIGYDNYDMYMDLKGVKGEATYKNDVSSINIFMATIKTRTFDIAIILQ